MRRVPTPLDHDRVRAGSGARQGPFAWSEDEVHAFMALVADGYLTGRATVPPQVLGVDAAWDGVGEPTPPLSSANV